MYPSLGRFAAFVGVVFASTCEHVAGDAFLRQSSPRDFDGDLRSAMASVMGCGAPAGASPHEHVDAIKLALTPMWGTLPKNRWGKVEWRMLRYAAHRYFMQQSSLLVRGLEPTRLVNSSALGTAHILSGTGDALVDTALVGKVNGQGFSLEDVAFMLATLERVIYVGESARLERAYREMEHDPRGTLPRRELQSVIETYVMLWMLGDDEESIALLLETPSLKPQVFPQWSQVRHFTVGTVRKMEFESSRDPQVGFGRAAMERSYSFEDAHEAVGHITKNFASFWETECQTIKASLVAMDKSGTGRVPVSDFYGANEDGEWQFGESEAYLRELGALDETSTLRGKQVIIPNYLQGVSNCIVSTPHYLVCCINECEEMLTDVQSAVGAPAAGVEAILGMVREMTNFDDQKPRLDNTLKRQLQRIAQIHGGQVPLHGRLFAQWMHFVFPRECPYPHRAGTASVASVMEFGSESFASDEEVRAHSARRNASTESIGAVQEAQWMSQWSEEEELGMDVNLGLAPWEREGAGRWICYGFGTITMLGLTWSLAVGVLKVLTASNQAAAGAGYKSHIV